MQYTDGSPIEPEGVLSNWRNNYDVVVREKCKIVCSWDYVTKEMLETLWGFIKEHYIFPYEQEKLAKMLRWKQYLIHFRGSDMLSTSTMCRGVCHC
jgi:hypothetical protein